MKFIDIHALDKLDQAPYRPGSRPRLRLQVQYTSKVYEYQLLNANFFNIIFFGIV